jgi:hypothetical protein
MEGKRLAEIHDRIVAAMPGPWEAVRLGNCLIEPHCQQVRKDGCKYTIATPVHSNDVTMANMNFIAHARQDVPDLLGEVEWLRLLLFKLTDGGYYGYECEHSVKIEAACIKCNEAYEAGRRTKPGLAQEGGDACVRRSDDL